MVITMANFVYNSDPVHTLVCINIQVLKILSGKMKYKFVHKIFKIERNDAIIESEKQMELGLSKCIEFQTPCLLRYITKLLLSKYLLFILQDIIPLM